MQETVQWLKSYVGTLSRRRGGALFAGAIVLVALSIFLFLPGVFLEGLLNARITRAFENAYPAYSIRIAGLHYRILENKLECDSVALMNVDSSFSCDVGKFSVSSIGCIQLLWGGGGAPDYLVSSDGRAEGIVMKFPAPGYQLRCSRLRVSVPDSDVVLDSLEFRPVGNDEQFFNLSRFSRTRFHLIVPRCTVKGSAGLSLLNGQIQFARIAQIQDPVLDVLIDNEKPTSRDSVRLLMPNELLSSIVKTIQLDRILVLNGQVKYGERYASGSKPARLTFDHVQLRAEDLSPNRDSVVVHAEGKLMDAGIVRAVVVIPIASPEFTFKYSGSLGGMELNVLNPFLEVSEHKRIKTGELRSASFDVNVTAGIATGTVRALYKDLKIVAIDDRSGSESGVGNTIVSFISNNIKLRTTNLPDQRGSMKIGIVKCSRSRGEAFFAFAWSALRSGLGDIVGF